MSELRDITAADLSQLSVALEKSGHFTVHDIGTEVVPLEMCELASLPEGGVGITVELKPMENAKMIVGIFVLVQPGIVDFDEAGARLGEMADQIWAQMKEEGVDQAVLGGFDEEE